MATKLTPKLIKQRRAIAEDVIAQLRAKKYVAVTGLYVSHDGLESWTNSGELQPLIKKKVTKTKPCEVCALGSALISAVKLFDNYPVVEGGVTKNMRRKLAEFFSKSELNVIEGSFEQSSNYFDRNRQLNEWSAAYNYQSFLDDLTREDRLTFLMQTIADNADTRITFKVLTTAALLELAGNNKFASVRADLGW